MTFTLRRYECTGTAKRFQVHMFWGLVPKCFIWCCSIRIFVGKVVIGGVVNAGVCPEWEAKLGL